MTGYTLYGDRRSGSAAVEMVLAEAGIAVVAVAARPACAPIWRRHFG